MVIIFSFCVCVFFFYLLLSQFDLKLTLILSQWITMVARIRIILIHSFIHSFMDAELYIYWHYYYYYSLSEWNWKWKLISWSWSSSSSKNCNEPNSFSVFVVVVGGSRQMFFFSQSKIKQKKRIHSVLFHLFKIVSSPRRVREWERLCIIIQNRI